MKTDYSVAETRNKLTSLLRVAESGGHVHITRRGKTVAVLLSIDEYERRIRQPVGFIEALRAFRKLPEARLAVMDDSFLDGLREADPGREVDI